MNLVDTLNSDQSLSSRRWITRFSRLPPEATAELHTDAALLTRLLTYHVIPGQLGRTSIVGTHPTLTPRSA